MGFVAEGHNYQDYMISHRWESEVEPVSSSTQFAETFAAETEPTLRERATATFMGLRSIITSQPLIVLVGVAGCYFLYKGLQDKS
jgi:hypothetical protein